MADQRNIGTIEIDRLYDFLDGLQLSGYTIEPRQYLALSDLFLMLVARGELLDELPLKTMIAPLVCSTPSEQEDFYERFDRWYSTLQPVHARIEGGEELTNGLPAPVKPRTRSTGISLNTLLWTVLAIAAPVSIWVIFRSGLNITAIQISPIIIYVAVGSVLGLLLFLIARWAWIQVQGKPYLTREPVMHEPEYKKVPVKSNVQEILPVMQFKTVVHALRKRTQIPSTEVDVERTIEKALNRNTWLEIVYRQRQVIPEYIALIDRKSRSDQQARFAQEVLARLAMDGVWLHPYEFSGDPRICFPLGQKGFPLHLKDLQARHPDSRLLVFSGLNELVDPVTGLIQDWLESLSSWQERVILSADKLPKAMLEELQSRDFVVLPMTFDGLASLVSAFERDNTGMFPQRGTGLPTALIERPLRWTGRTMPPETDVQAVVNEVRNYLGEDGFYWLCATAVYPELRWELTLHLGNTLVDDFGNPLLNVDTLIRLARLPWFRLGYMPDWLRLILINSFTPAQEDRTRRELKQLISTAYQGYDFELIFSEKAPDSLSSRVKRWLFSTIYRKSPVAEKLKDEIFIDFVLLPKSRKLSVALSDSLRKPALENIRTELDDRTTTDDAELLQRYEPVLRFAKSERFFPMAVEPYLEKCTIHPSGPQGLVELLSHPREPLATLIGKLKSGEYFLRFVNEILINSDVWRWWGIAAALLIAGAWFVSGWQGVQVAALLVLLAALIIFIQASPIRLRFFPAALTALFFLALEVTPIWFFLTPQSFISVQIEYLVLLPIYLLALFYLSVRVMKFVFDNIIPYAPGVVMDMLSNATEAVAHKSFQQYVEILEKHPQPVYYGRVARWQDVDGNHWCSLQYHYFYAFNDWRLAANGINHREGDWEMVAVYLKNDQPHSLLLSQHGTGAVASPEDVLWTKDKNGKETTHPLIYVALGSHANYNKPEVIRSSSLFQAGALPRFVYWLNGLIHFLFLLFNPSEKERQIALQELTAHPATALTEETFEKLRDAKDHYMVSLPLEIATGDGFRIGYAGDPQMEGIGRSSSYLKRSKSDREVVHPQSRNWKQVALSPEPTWVQYEGLWGVKSFLKEESGPRGPKWDRFDI